MSLPDTYPVRFATEYSLPSLSGDPDATMNSTHSDPGGLPPSPNEAKSASGPTTSHRKPDRLAVACKQCRRRKVRCDAEQPRCRNCASRNEVCETSDLRRPGKGATIRRRASKYKQSQTPSMGAEAASPPQSAISSSAAGFPHSPDVSTYYSYGHPSSVQNEFEPQSQARSKPRAVSDASTNSRPPSSGTAKSKGHKQKEDNISWLTRGYQASVAAQAEEVGEDPDESKPSSKVTPDYVVNTDGGPHRAKFLGGSSVQSLFTFVDLYLAMYGFDLACPLFRHGMLHSEEFQLPLYLQLPPLPTPPALTNCVEVFFDRIWPLYPVVDQANLESDIENLQYLQFSEQSDMLGNVQTSSIPALATVYALACIGINELSSHDGESSMEYLTASYQLHVHLVATPYMTSVQALLLLTLALRSRGKDGQAWHVLGQAIRMAHSLGLHKHAVKQASNKGPVQQQTQRLGERLWWSCYALEKHMQLECGRPSSIDSEYDELAVQFGKFENEDEDPSIPPFFKAWVSLAGIMGQISERLYCHKFDNAEELLEETVQLDKSLVEWEASLPDGVKPQNILPGHLDDALQIHVAFLSQQCYHAQIAAFRAAIIFPQHSFTAEIKKHGEKISDTSRLLAGATICAQAARSIATQTLQLADSGVRSPLIGISQSFLAAVVLALVTLRQPSSRLARSDVELIKSTTEYIESWYYYWGFCPGFIQVLTELRNRVASVFVKTMNSSRRRSSTSTGTPFSVMNGKGSGNNMDNVATSLTQSLQNWGGKTGTEGSMGLEGMDVGDPGMSVFGSLDLDELWNMMDLDFLAYDTEI